MKPRYMHFRYYDNKGILVGRGGATICVIIDETGSVANIGVAKCSAMDMFSRKIGRDISVVLAGGNGKSVPC